MDSADYSYPTDHHLPGIDDTTVFAPILQLFCNADNRVQTLRGMAYAQREVNIFTRHDDIIKLTAGLRGQYYITSNPQDSQFSILNSQFLLSPRIAASYKPHTGPDILYRVAAGIYRPTSTTNTSPTSSPTPSTTSAYATTPTSKPSATPPEPPSASTATSSPDSNPGPASPS